MPSGSRGGGGGSSGGGHSGGGGGSSGGSWGGGHSRSPRSYGYRHGHRVVFIHGSSGGYMRTSHSALITFLRILMIICVFGCFISSTLWSAEKDFKADIENEYTYYQEMISNAEANEALGQDYIIKAAIRGIYTRKDSSGKYRVLYKFQTITGDYNDGYTFDTYTKEEAEAIRAQGYIEIAVDSCPLTASTDSIDIAYKNTTLDDDGQYLYVKKQINKFMILTISCIAGIIVFGALQPILTKKFTKNDDGEVPANYKQSSVEGQTEQKYSYTTNVNYPPKKRRQCMYCKARIKDGESSCSKCGASVRDE